jgi:putative thiamine transport system permease protein
MKPGRLLAAAPVVTVATFALPIAAGLAGTLAPAFGYLPAIGGHALSLDPWRELAAWPGFASSVRLTLVTGFVSALLSAFLAFGFVAWAAGRPWGPRAAAWLAPILATPHSAFAIGLAFVIAPSGWLVRALSPWLTGFDVPPDVATVGHASGAALVLGMVVKEVPYLVLMTTAALAQVRASEHLAVARSMGYGPVEGWLRVVLPQVWPQVRLPFLAVLAYSLSVVDVALILGPGNPPTLAVLAVRWFADPDLRLWFPAAAAATLQLVVVAASIGAWIAVERAIAALGRRAVAAGRRASAMSTLARVAAAGVTIVGALAAASIAGMALWSVAAQWRFPSAWPSAFAFDNWTPPDRRHRVARGEHDRRGWGRDAVRARARDRLPRGRAAPPSRGARRRRSRCSTCRCWCRRSRSCSGAQVLLVRARLDGAVRCGRVGAPDLRAPLPVPVARRSLARARSALLAHGREPRRCAMARALSPSSCRSSRVRSRSLARSRSR